MLNFIPAAFSSLRTAAIPAITTALLLGSACAAQAAEQSFTYSSPFATGTSCAYSVLCSGEYANPAVQTILLAQQDDDSSDDKNSGASRQAASGKSTPGYPSMMWEDTKHVLTGPARWDEQEWRNMGLAALGIVGVIAVVDRPVQDLMRRIAPDNDPLTPDNNRFLHEMERFGREYSLGVLGGFYLAGALGDNETATAVAQDGLTSVILASGIITTAVKISTGRARPRQDQGVADFNPFGGNDSFPSGHVTHAFAIASVIANHYDETWVTCTSYSVASLVGVARSYHGGHFASDILAAAMIGTLVGKSVVEHNKSIRSGKVVLLPEVTPGRVGMRIASSF